MRGKRFAAFLCAALCLLLASCSFADPGTASEKEDWYQRLVSANKINTDSYLHIASGEMDTVDPQCTTEFYLVALNVFDRLVELKIDVTGQPVLTPSLAEEWETSEDGLTYRFRLREGVNFSNGHPLTASDVRFTFERLLTNRKSVHADLVMSILGAPELRAGKAKSLAGFRELDELSFEITLAEPYTVFLESLSTPGASILDEETLNNVNGLFGVHGPSTVGTGAYIVRRWTRGSEMVLEANPNCWSGAPRLPGVYIRMLSDAESRSNLYEKGELDILDLDGLGCGAEPFIHGVSHQSSLVSGQRVGVTFLALNQSVAPLNDVRVRKALQYALDRQTILNAVYSGRGSVENGIFPVGLDAHNPNLPAIPYDTARAKELLAEAGFPDGFALELTVSEDDSLSVRESAEIVAYMWGLIGVNVEIRTLDGAEYAIDRRAGRLACCLQSWTAELNDPDNFIYTFFGSSENSVRYGLCYSDEEVMARVRAARAIVDDGQRLAEYHALEEKIVQEDAAWVPLYSYVHYFAVGSRVKNYAVPWNGSSASFYGDVWLIGKNK